MASERFSDVPDAATPPSGPPAGPHVGPEAALEVETFRQGRRERATEAVVVEEPLEIRLGDRRLLVTMRTPGHDFDLVRGLLFTEGLIDRPDSVTAVTLCRDVPAKALGNVVTVALRDGAALDEVRAGRVGSVSSACGVCGKDSLEALSILAPVVEAGLVVAPEVILGLPDSLRGGQAVFETTGGLHAAGLFDPTGRLLSLREDVGRHNAVDKVVGEAARFGRLPLSDTLLMVSGRASFEIVSKARRAGIPIVCSVSAPSSLAVDLARDGHQTLVGFLREQRFNVYAGPERIGPSQAAPT